MVPYGNPDLVVHGNGPLDAVRFAASHHIVRRALDVLFVDGLVGRSDGARHQDRVRDLVVLHAERVGVSLVVDQAVARRRAIRLLLALEQETHRRLRGVDNAGRQQTGDRLVQIPSKTARYEPKQVKVGSSAATA